MTSTEKLICSILIMVGLISFEILVDRAIYPVLTVIDKREYIIVPYDAPEGLKDIANVICDKDDCTDQFNLLLSVIPEKTGGTVLLPGKEYVFNKDSGSIMLGRGVTIDGMDATLISE